MSPSPRIVRNLASVGLALLSATAGAGQHAICFQGENSGGAPTGTFACDEGAGGTCSITPLGGPWKLLATQLSRPLPGKVAVYAFPAGAYNFQARIDFISATGQARSRTCTVNLADPATGARGMASAGAELTGYSTDASGLVTTGVWKVMSPTSGRSVVQTLMVPGDFIAVGGGVTGTDAPYGSFVVESLQADSGIGNHGTKDWRFMRQWVVKTSDISIDYAQVHRNTGYVIGMRVEGRINTRNFKGGQPLKDVVRVAPQHYWPATTAVPVNDVIDDTRRWTPMSGSVQAVAQPSAPQDNTLGQFLIETAPGPLDVYWYCAPGGSCPFGSDGRAWRVASKDHLVSRPGTINAAMLLLPPKLEIEGIFYTVEFNVVAAASVVTAHPTATVGGLKGEFALTGIGASVDCCLPGRWSTSAGNLIWKLEPRPDIGGATVASKDFAVSAPASITAFGIGIKLVPVP